MARPLRNACQPCQRRVCFLERRPYDIDGERFQVHRLSAEFIRKNEPVLRSPHLARCCSRRIFSGAMIGMAALLLGRFGSSTWLRQTDFMTRISTASPRSQGPPSPRAAMSRRHLFQLDVKVPAELGRVLKSIVRSPVWCALKTALHI